MLETLEDDLVVDTYYDELRICNAGKYRHLLQKPEDNLQYTTSFLAVRATPHNRGSAVQINDYRSFLLWCTNKKELNGIHFKTQHIYCLL